MGVGNSRTHPSTNTNRVQSLSVVIPALVHPLSPISVKRNTQIERRSTDRSLPG